MADRSADCFLAHSADDKPAVEALARRLRAEGLEPWLDEWNLIPGRPWQSAIEEALATCGACVVFIGPSGLGPWQSVEMRAAIERCIDHGAFSVIPVLLPGASREPRSRLPAFLVRATWIEFRNNLDDAEAFRRLVCGIRGIAPGPGPNGIPYPGECPYLGLRTFREKDARFFFGREARTEWLLDKIRPTGNIAQENRFLAVIGASGSGKSSLVRAGLIPAVRAGKLPGSAAWPIVVLRPGHNPIESLAVALAADGCVGKVASDEVTLMERLTADMQWLHLLVRRALHEAEPEQRAMIVVDQLEEVFTLGEDEGRRRAFIDCLLYAASIRGGQTVVVITMRADFYGKCADYTRLAEALSEQQELVSPMTADELRAAIERPAQLTGYELEAGLTELLVQHMSGRSGALPLLQHALAELWNRRAGRKLTLAAYRDMGSLEGALEQHAEKVLGELAEAEQAICQSILLRLVQPGEGTEDTRRRASQAELGGSDATGRVLARLADARLVTTEGSEGRHGQHGYVEISHEALIRGWSRLRGWIEASRDMMKIQHRLAAAAQEWSERREQANAEDYLYRGARLAEIEERLARRGLDMNDMERAFLEASIGLRDREAREREAQHQRELERERAAAERLRRRGRIIAGVGGFALVGAIAALVLFFQAQSAQEREQRANRDLQKTNTDLEQANSEARERLVRIQALNGVNERDRNNDPLKAMHYFARAAEQTADAATERNWRFAAEYLTPHLGLRAVMPQKDILGAKFSPDQMRVLTWGDDGTAQVWDANTGKPLYPALPHGDSAGPVWSHDGAHVFTWGGDTAQVWDANTGKLLYPALQHKEYIDGLELSPDGKRVLTWGDGIAQIWNASTGEALFSALQHQQVRESKWSPDGARVLTWSYDDTVHVWDASTGERLISALHADYGLPGVSIVGVSEWQIERNSYMPIEGPRWSPDGTRILTFKEYTAQVSDTRTGRAFVPALQYNGFLSWAEWNRDGTRLLVLHNETAQLWNPSTGKLITLAWSGSFSYLILSGEWSQDGSQVLTWSEDGTAQVWDTRTGKPLRSAFHHNKAILGGKWSPDGSRVLTWSEDGTARVWEIDTSEGVITALHHDKIVWGGQWSQDGTRVLTWSRDGTARVWDSSTGEALTPPLPHKDSRGKGPEWSKDGTRVLTWNKNGEARLWDTSIGKPLLTTSLPEERIEKVEVKWSQDGERVLLILDTDNFSALVLDPSTGSAHTLASQDKHTICMYYKWSPDGARVLTQSEDGTVQVLDANTGKSLTLALQHHKEGFQTEIERVEWRPDGTQLLTITTYGGTQLWNAITGQARSTLQLEADDVEVKWHPDGAWVMTWNKYGARVWDASTGKTLTFELQDKERIQGVAWSPDGARVLTLSEDGTARVWEAIVREGRIQLSQHKDAVRGTQLSPDGARVLTWSEEGTSWVWEANTGKDFTLELKHKDAIEGAEWSPDGARVLTFSEDGTVRVWEASTGKGRILPVQNLRETKWSLDGARLLTMRRDLTVQVWNAKTDEALTPALRQHAFILSNPNSFIDWNLEWSPDGARVLVIHDYETFGYGDMAWVWDASTGLPLMPPMNPGGFVNGAKWSPDESRLLTWSKDGAVRLWDLESDASWPKDHLAFRYEVLSGTRLNSGGDLEAIPAKEWYAMKQQYDEIARSLPAAPASAAKAP